MSLHHLAVMFGIPILSPALFMRVGDPYIPPFLILDLLVFLVSFRQVATQVHVYMHKPLQLIIDSTGVLLWTVMFAHECAEHVL